MSVPLPRPDGAPTRIGISGSGFVARGIFAALSRQPDLAVIREGRKVLVPVAELERWVRDRAAPTLPGATGGRPRPP